jgi:hypothetical protein
MDLRGWAIRINVSVAEIQYAGPLWSTFHEERAEALGAVLESLRGADPDTDLRAACFDLLWHLSPEAGVLVS